MKKISSAQNPLVKKLVQLSKKQSFRNKQNLTIVEGAHLAGEWLKTYGSPDICVFLSSSKSIEVKQIVQKCKDLNTEIIEIEQEIYAKISPVVEGVGIFFVVKKGTVSAWSPKVLRAGMGAHFKLQIFENQDLNEVISKVETPIFATSLQAKKSIYDDNFTTKTAWIFGNEGAGVSLELLSKVKNQVIIPQVGEIESLNVAMAVTVCLAEQARQRLKA